MKPLIDILGGGGGVSLHYVGYYISGKKQEACKGCVDVVHPTMEVTPPESASQSTFASPCEHTRNPISVSV